MVRVGAGRQGSAWRVLFTLCLGVLLAGVSVAGEESRWVADRQAATLQAIRERKPVLIVLLEQDNASSATLERRLESAKTLQPLLDRFVCVKLDKAQAPDLTKRFHMPRFPVLLFTTARGRPIKLVVGGVSLGKARGQMKEALRKYAKLLDPASNVPKTRPRSVAPRTPANRRMHPSTCPRECEHCSPAVERALAWLARRQRANGSWDKLAQEKVTRTEKGEILTRSIDRIDVALTSVAGLALLAGGARPDAGEHAAALRRAVDYVKRCVRENGAIAPRGGEDFLSQAHATFETSLGAMFLSEVQRLAPSDTLREKLTTVSRALEQAQDPKTGGWGYGFDSREHSPWEKRGWRLLATTHCCMTALHAMRDAGVEVSPDVLERGVRYLRSCLGRDGAFAYRTELRGGDGYAGATAGALFAMSRSGAATAEELAVIRTRYRRHYRDLEKFGEHWWFFLFFSALAASDRGEGAWQDFHDHFRDVLLENQDEDGSWREPDEKAGRVFSTAIAAFVLQFGRRHLPIAGARTGEREIAPVERPRYLRPPHPSSRVKVFEHEGRYLVDLVVSVDGPADAAYFENLANSVRGANRLLWDVTDGQMSLHRVELLGDAQRWDAADVMITTKFYEDPDVPRSGAHGITMVSKRTVVSGEREKPGKRIGEWVKLPYFLGVSDEAVPWQNRGLVRVFAHELCHYLLGIQDEYGVGGSYCACIVGDRTTTELCVAGEHTDDRRELSCWRKAEELYPLLRAPAVPDPGPWDPPRPVIVTPR